MSDAAPAPTTPVETPPGWRQGGITTISGRAVHRIAGEAATGAQGVIRAAVSGAPSEIELGDPAGMRLTVNASLAYPDPVADTIEGLRTELKRQLGELIGKGKGVRVDVIVDELLPPRSYRSRARVQ